MHRKDGDGEPLDDLSFPNLKSTLSDRLPWPYLLIVQLHIGLWGSVSFKSLQMESQKVKTTPSPVGRTKTVLQGMLWKHSASAVYVDGLSV